MKHISFSDAQGPVDLKKKKKKSNAKTCYQYQSDYHIK